ncbi:UDP-glucose 4-epimerase [Fulvivirga imtechensis AK7]|uniref:UDP-glucose 4-epimerase n=1 Tax=Fulvivirga imtechensis AK7 TaxID=1237149 RepID=L8JJZ8_9BACT|nr:NAD-dependent epimerase/dehydratase family protein [Fulvivirga imtechensis]ELR69135.1 UDP-glucose 4-epimerase [Fulvivirga imtechensis AK7]
MKKILITGGAGFIGSHLGDELIKNKYEVIALDNLSEQVHGPDCFRPEYLNDHVQLINGDVRDKHLLEELVQEVDAVYHFAALVGVGQSMYEIKEYTDVNNLGTATLLEALIKNPVKKLVVASSMSIYGEGLYQDQAGKLHQTAKRSIEQLKNNDWETYNGEGKLLTPIATPEFKAPNLSSVYALSKYDQERLCLMTGQAYNIPTTALRFFNVYGTRQSLSNPYTGVLAIFSSRLLNERAPLIFEDGNQQRDFVHVRDVARACRLALETDQSAQEVFNIGSGESYSIRALAQLLAETMGKEYILPEITGEYRVGDIRHCFADISKANRILGYSPQVSLQEGMRELVEWLEDQMAEDHVDKAKAELSSRGLTV